MFLGQFQHNLDEKGRLMVPAPFRQSLEGGAFITQGFDRCLMVMTEAYFRQVYERIHAMNLATPCPCCAVILSSLPGGVG
jgi:MraZ protein